MSPSEVSNRTDMAAKGEQGSFPFQDEVHDCHRDFFIYLFKFGLFIVAATKVYDSK